MKSFLLVIRSHNGEHTKVHYRVISTRTEATYFRVLGVDTRRILALVTENPDCILDCSTVRVDPEHTFQQHNNI